MNNSNRCTCNLSLIVLALFVSIAVVVSALFYSTITGDSSPTNSPDSRVSQSLKFVVVVSRHGGRRALSSLPNETTHWNYGIGELTTRGRIQAYNLGVKVRSLYDGFLSTEYQSANVLASSTAIDRTMMSGELFLAGLYPPKGYQIWNSQLLWQPIPLYPNSPDKSQFALKICPRFAEENADAMREFVLENADNLSSTNSYLSEHLSLNVTGPQGLFNIWDILFCEDQEGFPLPDWTKTVYPQPMEDLISRAYMYYCAGTPSMIRLSIGTFFQEVGSLLMSKMNGSLSPESKLHYYSVHDTTIVGLQALLGVPKESFVGFVWPSSAMIFELHQSSEGTFFVEVLFIDGRSTSSTPRLVVVPECGNPCYLDTLISITQQYTNISNYDQECQSSSTSNMIAK